MALMPKLTRTPCIPGDVRRNTPGARRGKHATTGDTAAHAGLRSVRVAARACSLRRRVGERGHAAVRGGQVGALDAPERGQD